MYICIYIYIYMIRQLPMGIGAGSFGGIGRELCKMSSRPSRNRLAPHPSADAYSNSL